MEGVYIKCLNPYEQIIMESIDLNIAAAVVAAKILFQYMKWCNMFDVLQLGTAL